MRPDDSGRITSLFLERKNTLSKGLPFGKVVGSLAIADVQSPREVIV